MLPSVQQGGTIPLPCARPSRCQLVNLLATAQPVLTASSPDGFSFQAAEIDRPARRKIKEVQVDIQEDVRVHFVQSEYAHWYYFIRFSAFHQRYECSCNQAECKHVCLVQAA
jgi:hypothetical protein